MKRFEVIMADVTKPRLTVAKDRTTLKIPLSCPIPQREQLIVYAEKIHEDLDVKNTIRGQFKNTGITLWPDGRVTEKNLNRIVQYSFLPLTSLEVMTR